MFNLMNAMFSFNLVRTSSHEGGLPLTLGRDFSGVVVDAGMAAGFEPGDEVWGTVFPANPSGSHAGLATNSIFFCFLLGKNH